MKNKNRRQEAIKRLVVTGSAANQETLLGLLHAEGFDCTQATLSRDLRELQVIKIPSENKGYVYSLAPEKEGNSRKNTQFRHLWEGFMGWKMSGNMLVITTLPGYASSIALAVDHARIPEFLGTIAGDDTIFAVLKENITKEEIKRVLGKSFPYIRNKI